MGSLSNGFAILFACTALVIICCGSTADAIGPVAYSEYFDVWEGELGEMDCRPYDALVYITDATWSPFSGRCPRKFNRLERIRARCQDKPYCPFKPHWTNDYGDYVNMDDVCVGIGEYLRGTYQCRNPCRGMNCGGGVCKMITALKHRCDCKHSYVNEGANQTGRCILSKCHNNPCSPGRCRLTDGNRNYTCYDCPVGTKYMSGTCKKYDTCQENNGGCKSPATCTDGFGKEPTCVCPEYMKLEGAGCKPVDSCKTNNGGCPPEATCSDGLGKQGTCTCPEFHVLTTDKCEPVDQCTINNGGCDKMGKCVDGLGKEPNCECPDFYEPIDKKCVDIDECKENHGGCHEDATCTNNIGAPHECKCKDKYAGDGKTSCLKIGSFLMPDNGTLKMTVAQAGEPLLVELGACLNVSVDPRTSNVVLKNMSSEKADKNPQNLNLPKKYTEANLIFLFHRSKDTMMVYVNSGDSDAFDDNAAYSSVPWNKDCRIDEFSIRGPASLSHDTYMYRTTNIASDITAELSNLVELPEGTVVEAKPMLPGAVDKNDELRQQDIANGKVVK